MTGKETVSTDRGVPSSFIGSAASSHEIKINRYKIPTNPNGIIEVILFMEMCLRITYEKLSEMFR